MHAVKTLPARVKTVDDTVGDGIVEAIVATYDVDSIGDRIVPGAFAKSLDEWKQRGDSGERLPFIWSHMHDDLDAFLGDVIDAKETDEGLWVRAQLDMEDPKAAKAFRLIKGGRVRNYSFAYEVIKAEPDTEGDGELALHELRLFEVGPTLIGMNQNTRTLVAKHDERFDANAIASRIATTTQLKVGRVISATNERSLRDAYDAIGAVLAQLDDEEPVDQPVDAPSSSSATQGDDTQPEEPAKRHDSPDAKSDGMSTREMPTPAGPVEDDLRLETALHLIRKDD